MIKPKIWELCRKANKVEEDHTLFQERNNETNLDEELSNISMFEQREEREWNVFAKTSFIPSKQWFSPRMKTKKRQSQ